MNIRILGCVLFFSLEDLDLKENTDAIRMVFDQCQCIVSDTDLRCCCSVHAVPLIGKLRFI